MGMMIENETYTSILDFVLGGLFILFTYHIFRFLGNHLKAYLYYSLYALFSFLAYLSMLEGGFLKYISDFLGFNAITKQFFTLLYNYTYFFFFTSFLDLEKLNKKYCKIVLQPVYIAIGLTILVFSSTVIFGSDYLSKANLIFLTFIVVQTIVSFYLLLKIKNDLKWYIIVGGLSLFFTSMIGARPIREVIGINVRAGDLIFYIGLLLESILFAIALGQKWKKKIKEKELTQTKLITQLQRNEILKEKIMRQKEETLQLENEKIKIANENADLALAALRSQINPHFIYNALNSIKSYILFNDKESAVEYLNKFSRLIRLILNASFEKESTLLAEVEVTKLYVDIENIRFDGEIRFEVEVEDGLDLRDLIVPPLILQPFIENAIWHGIAGSPKKDIKISICKNEEDLSIKIRDSGLGFNNTSSQQNKLSKSRKSYGLRIAAQMLSKFYHHHSITYADATEFSENERGTVVSIKIPSVPKEHILNKA